MNTINFRKHSKTYSADYQRLDGFGLERRFYRISDVDKEARGLGWDSPDEVVPLEDCTVAEMLIRGRVVTPFRVVRL